jgi:hypothetical protein
LKSKLFTQYELKKIVVITIAVSLLILLIFSIPRCGEITDELQRKLATVNSLYGDKIDIEVIPCEMRYLNIRLKELPAKEIPFDSIHAMLYDKAGRSGWITLMVYDSTGKYLFSHSSENKIYIQHGD